jgi:DNA polymerase
MATVFLDFETRSRAKLDEVGSWRYSIDPSSSIICLAYALNDGAPEIWIEGQQPPAALMRWISGGARVRGWNSMSFERAIFENIAGPQLGWHTPKLEQYDDTMLDALALALPAKLDTCSKILGVEQKDKEGRRLIQFLCKPIASGKRKGEFRTREEFPNEYISMYHYCKQDVVSERSVCVKLPYHVSGKEKDLAVLTARINERGLPVDIACVDAVIEGIDEYKELYNDRFSGITGLEKATQREKFTDWMLGEGVAVDNLQAITIENMLAEGKLPNNVHEALELKQTLSLSSIAKYYKLKDMVCPDGTIKNNLIYHKAGTGRFAGAGFQGQNLPALTLEDPEYWIDQFMMREYSWIDIFMGIFVCASGLIRAMIKAPEGKKFLSGDLKGIEARDTAWVAGETEMLDNFRRGIDAYVTTAAGMYGITTDVVSKIQRAAGKISVLAGGFGGGYKAQVNMAIKMGMELSVKQAKKNTRDFRRGRPKLVQTWENFENAAKAAIQNPGMLIPVDTTRKFHFIMEGTYLFMILPSGRRLSFPFAEYSEQPYFGNTKYCVNAMWTDSKTKQWVRRVLTGANLFQSGVQASSRDILTDGHLRVEEEGDMPLILSVHDEGLSMVDDEPRYNADMYGKIMTVTPDWAVGLPIESDCWEGYRFRK